MIVASQYLIAPANWCRRVIKEPICEKDAAFRIAKIAVAVFLYFPAAFLETTGILIKRGMDSWALKLEGRAFTQIQQKNFTLALALLDEAIAINPNRVEALTLRSRLYLEQKNRDLALKDLAAILVLKPDNAYALKMRENI